MTGVTEGVINTLKATVGVANLVADQVFPSYAPQGTRRPYIVVDQSGGEPGYHSLGEDGLQESQFTITYYDGTPLKAENGGEQIRLTFSGRPAGDLGGIHARRTIVDDIRDRHVGPGGEGDQSGFPAREVIVTVWHQIPKATFT